MTNLDSKLVDQNVILRARIHNIRVKGNLAFLVLRKGFATVQAVAAKSETISKDFLKYLGAVPRESILDIYGKVTKPAEEIKSCSQSDVELSIEKFYVVTRSEPVLPLQMEDAMRKVENQEEEEEKDEDKSEMTQTTDAKEKMPTVPLKLRLDNRILDLRTPCNQAVFRLQGAVCHLFREIMMKMDFNEIHTPKLLGGASEGGANCFAYQYFGKPGVLAQSPQLYKQMCVMADFERVFEIGPVFRAENSNTPRHLCEFTGLDFEMEIKESYHEVLDSIEETFAHMFEG